MKQARRAALTAATVSTVHAQGTAGFGARLQAVPAMIRDTLSGEYDGLGKGRLFAMVLALAYLVSPIDLVPEALLTIPGLVDDTAIAVWLLAAAVTSAEVYLAHKNPQPIYATATVVETAPRASRSAHAGKVQPPGAGVALPGAATAGGDGGNPILPYAPPVKSRAYSAHFQLFLPGRVRNPQSSCTLAPESIGRWP